MITNNCVDSSWSHLEWWNALFNVYQHRTAFSSTPLSLKWCPAHVLEDTHEDLFTQQMAFQHNTTRIDLLRKRRTDRAAKRALHQSCNMSRQTWEIRNDNNYSELATVAVVS